MTNREDKLCQACGCAFTPKMANRRYCYSCDVSSREKAARESKVESRVCAQCGAGFESSRTKAKFCSAACRIKHHTRKSEGFNGRASTCSECGAGYVMRSKTNLTCSAMCARRRISRLSGLPKVDKVCVVCASTFTPARVLDVCCSRECSDRRRRKARDKFRVCVDCGSTFVQVGRGVAKRCAACRDNPTVEASAPCAYCGRTFRHATTESSRFCSRSCSAKGIHTEGLGNAYDRLEKESAIVEFIRTARHTPTAEECCVVAGVSRKYYEEVLGGDIGGFFEKAGRKNKSTFPSKFEEMVYYALLDIGIANEDIERQKKFPGLYYKHEGYPLRYDFFIPRLNLLVEADGPQHADTHTGHWFKKPSDSDARKDAYASSHNLRLARVPYSPTFKGVSKSVRQRLSAFVQQ